MADALFGYDMLLQITQNEINSQFEYLTTEGYISPKLETNALAQSGGAFGGGALSLSSYLRGYMQPPTVTLAVGDNPENCLFQFIMTPQAMTSSIMQASGITQQQLEAAFANPQPGPNGSVYDLLVNLEDIPYESNGQPATLPNQTVYYWLQRTSVTIGTTTTFSYSLIPALFYISGSSSTLVDLSGLPIRFTVNLDAIPTTPAGIQELVSAGLMPQQVLDTLTGNSFNSAYFSLQQLFLNFDTTDFTQWSTTAPPSTTLVTGASVNTANNTFSVSTLALSVLEEDPSFLTDLSVALQYAFGVGSNYQGNPAATPYIIGVAASSNNPAESDPNAVAFLVPTSIGFSSLANTNDPGLSVLTYQVMGGGASNATQPPPKVNTNFVTTNDYSGEMLFSEASFFTPEIFNPLVTALTSENAPTPVWQQSGSSFTYATTYSWVLSSTPPPSNWFKTGTYQVKSQQESPNYKIVVDGSNVTASGSLSVTQQMQSTLVVFGIDINVVFSVTCSSTFTQTMTMAVANNDELTVTVTENTFTAPVNGPVVANNWEAGLTKFVIDIVNDLLSILFPPLVLESELNPTVYLVDTVQSNIDASIGQISAQLNSNLIGSASTNFIAPTGSVFFLNAPRFNDTLDLQMDVTYSD